MEKGNLLRVALSQISPVWLDKLGTLKKIEKYILEAAKNDRRIRQTPPPAGRSPQRPGGPADGHAPDRRGWGRRGQGGPGEVGRRASGAGPGDRE